MGSAWGGGEAIGWTVVTKGDDEMVGYEITTSASTSVTSGALFLDQVVMAQMVLGHEQSGANELDALLMAVAQEVHADLLITERAALLQTRLLDDANCQASSPADALALTALYLRADRQFILVKLPK